MRCWLNGGVMLEVWYFCIGVFVLYVVVVKGYIEVMRLFFQVGYDLEFWDGDGWIFLYVVVYWGVEDVCCLLVEYGGGMDLLIYVGQCFCDLVDEEVLSLLEELVWKQEDFWN